MGNSVEEEKVQSRSSEKQKERGNFTKEKRTHKNYYKVYRLRSVENTGVKENKHKRVKD